MSKYKHEDDDEDDEDESTPRRGARTAQRIPQHKHCMICNKAIPAKITLCSDECEEKYKAIESKRRNYMYIMYALFAFIILMVIFSL
jgi:predicted nucleic acid-binding Zn ribbon protein